MPFERIINQGYALRAFSCKAHLFRLLDWLSVALRFALPAMLRGFCVRRGRMMKSICARFPDPAQVHPRSPKR